MSTVVPFPKVPAGIREKYSDYNLCIRSFGLYREDLDVDFSNEPQPYTITKILQCCTADINGKLPKDSFFWDLSIGKRIECLLIILDLTEIEDPFLDIKCLNPKCLKLMEIDLSIDELAKRQHLADDVDSIIVDIGGRRTALRKPNGFDQIDLLRLEATDNVTMTKQIIQRLEVDQVGSVLNQVSTITEEMLDSLDKSMSEFDPLINISLPLVCPYCEKENIYEIELEKFALEKLQGIQRRLIHLIHIIAKRYHWSEQEIFSIPVWRRSQYLSLIEKDENDF